MRGLIKHCIFLISLTAANMELALQQFLPVTPSDCRSSIYLSCHSWGSPAPRNCISGSGLGSGIGDFSSTDRRASHQWKMTFWFWPISICLGIPASPQHSVSVTSPCSDCVKENWELVAGRAVCQRCIVLPSPWNYLWELERKEIHFLGFICYFDRKGDFNRGREMSNDKVGGGGYWLDCRVQSKVLVLWSSRSSWFQFLLLLIKHHAYFITRQTLLPHFYYSHLQLNNVFQNSDSFLCLSSWHSLDLAA